MKINKVFIRFIIVGIANTVFGTAIMFLAYNLHLSYWISSAANYFFGSILSYFLNKYYTFGSKNKSWKEVIRFILNIGLCYFISYGIARPFIRYILYNQEKNIQDNCAMVIGMIIFMIINYVGQNVFVFRNKNVMENETYSSERKK